MGILKTLNKQMFLNWQGYLAGIFLVALATGLKYLAEPDIIPSSSTLLYMLAVVITAIVFGLGPSIFVSIASVLVYNYIFIPDIFILSLGQVQHIPTLAVFLSVGVVISLLASNLRHKTEETTKANEEIQLRATILDKAIDTLLLRELNNNILYANDAASEFYGYKKEELTHMDFHSLIASREYPYYEERTKKVLENGYLWKEQYHMRKDRTEIPVEVHSHRIKIGHKEYILSVIKDITEEIKIREERETFNKKLLEAQEEERKRIAVELHDDASPSLAYLCLELDAITTKCVGLSEETCQRLREIREKINAVQQNIRRYSHELHPAMLDNLGLEPALENLVAELNSQKLMEIQFDVSGVASILPDKVNLALYRITQEALNNVRKHSKATKAMVRLEYSIGKVLLDITDNGIGFNTSAPLKNGLGLVSMRERANLIGAELKVESSFYKGTSVKVEINA